MEDKDQPRRILPRPISAGYLLDKLHQSLRLDMNPDLCALYIFVFYFYKYLNDLYRDKENTPFVIPESCRFDYIYKNRNKKKIGMIINEVITELEKQNEDKLKGLLSIVDFNSNKLGRKNYRNLKLIHLIEEFSQISFNSPQFQEENRITEIFYRFISSNFSRGNYVPIYQAELLTKLLNPEDGESIGDPFCNAGSLLNSFALLNPDKDLLFYGQEKNKHLWALCKMGLYLQGIFQGEIHCQDNLSETVFSSPEQKYDLVVSSINYNPRVPLPLRLRMEREGSRRFKTYYDKISRAVEMMGNDKGRAGIIVPALLLSNSDEYRDFWENIINKNLLDAVIGFSAYSYHPGYFRDAILLFRKNRSTTDVLFINVENRIRRFLKRINRDKNLEKVINIYREYRTVENFSCRTVIEKIRENNFSIDINSYLDTEKKEYSDIDSLKTEIEQLEAELQKVRQSLDSKLKEIDNLD